MDGVLAVKEQNIFLECDVFDVVAPDRELVLEPKFMCRVERDGALLRIGRIRAAYLEPPAIGEAKELGNVIEHDRASKWRRQRGDQQSVISPRDASGNGSRGVAAK